MDNTAYENMINGMCFTHRHDFGLLDEQAKKNIRTHMWQIFEHNIKPIIDSLQCSEAVEGKELSVVEEIDLIKKLSATDATLVNMAFGVSEELGLAAFENSTQGFESFLRSRDNKFIHGMSIEWRTYLVELLMLIDDKYRDIATARILLGR